MGVRLVNQLQNYQLIIKMLEGSIKKYRPSKRPSPYNREQMRALQGIGGGRKNTGQRLQSTTLSNTFTSRKASSVSRQHQVHSIMKQVNQNASILEQLNLQAHTEESVMKDDKPVNRMAMTMREQTSPWRAVHKSATVVDEGAQRPQFSIAIPQSSQHRNHDGGLRTDVQTSRRNTAVHESLVINEEAGCRTSTVHDFAGDASPRFPQTTRPVRNDQMAMTHGAGFAGASGRGGDRTAAATPNNLAKVNSSLYSESHQMSQLGRQIHQKLRAAADRVIELDPTRTASGRMHFGSIGKYSGMREKPRALAFTLQDSQQRQGADDKRRTSSLMAGGDGRSALDGTANSSPFRNRQAQGQIAEALRSSTANKSNGKGRFSTIDGRPSVPEEEDLSVEQTDSRWGDSYLPALRTFKTTLRAPNKPVQTQVAEFKKTQLLESQKPMVPKLVNRETINYERTESLFERQRNILVHAQMQRPVKKPTGKSSALQKTRFKDWLIDEVERKVREKETEAVPAAQAQDREERSGRGGDSSDDVYDPLADSDGSSARSETPPRLTGAEIQSIIKTEMKLEGHNPKLHKTTFWKDLVRAEPEAELDEFGEPIPVKAEKELTSFQMIKRMMRLKQKQDAMPEHEKVERFTPKIKPQFVGDGKEQYYFDMKNNREHYELLTSDMTPEQFKVYEDREKLRADALHHTRQFMQQLVARKIEEDNKLKAERRAAANKNIDVDNLPEYQSTLFQHDKEDLFDDDDELVMMQILMDTCARTETKIAAKAHISKHKNKKIMLCPQKALRMDEFARDIVNGIIWDEVRERKVNSKALMKMGFQQKYGLEANKRMLREKKLADLSLQLGKIEATSPLLRRPPVVDLEKDQQLHKDLFVHSQKKQQFFDVAKQMQNTQDIQQSSNAHAPSYMRFYQKCQKSGTLALPIFSKAHNQIFSLVGQFISEGMAQAMSEVLRRVHQDQTEDQFKKVGFQHQKTHIVEEEKVPYIPIREINLDDNGLKDHAFAHILNALATQPTLKRLSYVNNEIGERSIVELEKLLSMDAEGDLTDLRLTRVKSTKHELNLLLQALANQNSNRLTRLRLSMVEIDEFVLMNSLKLMVDNMPQIQELNLQAINIHGRQLAELMERISENCQRIKYLNISYNSLPMNKEWLKPFLTHLVTMIKSSSNLIMINLSGMNFRENVKEIQWPLAKSQTLQSIHLSDNNIPKAVETNMLMVFGVKSNEGDAEFSIAGKLDPRQQKRNAAMTGFQIKMQQQLDIKQQKTSKDGKFDFEQYLKQKETGAPDSTMGYEDATARIANAVEIRDMKQDRNYHQSYMKGGLGRGHQTVQPLVLTRKLGHPELIFNEHVDKNTHFKVHASAKWARMQSNECWICDQWKYTVIFFSRENSNQHYGQITDQERIDQLEEMYDLKQEDQFIVENKALPLLLGSVTKNTVVQMTDISMFNLFLDEKNIKKTIGDKGERAMKAILQVSQGMKNTFKSQISVLTEQDWLSRFKENLPFPERDMLICNIPESAIADKIERGERLSKAEIDKRKWESTSDVFVFAGYVQPGKHQIIIKDQETGNYYAREIVIDARNREIINCHQVEPEKENDAIKRFTVNQATGSNKTVLDLDNSVFMNFKRYTKLDVANCFEADMRSSSFENVLQDETELNFCALTFEENYATYCQAFHEISAQFDHFPMIDLKDLPQVLYALGIFAIEKARPVSEKVIAEYRKTIAENAENQGIIAAQDEEEELLNRVKFAEVLLSVIKVNNEEIEHASISRELRLMFKEHITPFLIHKQPEQIGISLNAFRDQYVWVEKINTLFELNLEGIMEVFLKNCEDVGFTINSAVKLLKGIGCLLSNRIIRMQFDLAQMTVIDESVNSDEYEDMEFVEFLEFLVRLAFQIYITEDRSIMAKLSDLLNELLSSVGFTFIEAPRNKSFQSQASEDDMMSLHSYITKK